MTGGEKLGLLGGTFDPVHRGHIALALGFKEALGLDRVLLMPVWQPPHKEAARLLPGEQRLEMCRLAAQDEPALTVSDLELRRGGKSYTAQTLQALSGLYPGAQLYLLTGADMFCTLSQWRAFDEIVRLAVLCGAARRPGELARLREYAQQLETQYGARCHVVDLPVKEVSSTEVRQKLKAGGDVSQLLCAPVEAYIRQNGLYGAAAF